MKEIEKYDSPFSKVSAKKRAYQGAFPLLDLSIGEEKEAPNPLILKKVKKAMESVQNQKYPDDGWSGLIPHFCAHMKRRYQADVPSSSVMIGCGAKALLWDTMSYLIHEGDIVVVTTPAYDVVEKIARIQKAEVMVLPLKKELGNLPDLSSLPMKIWKKVKLLSLNFPNNPTGSYPDEVFFEELTRIWKKCSFYLLNDAAYMALRYDEHVLPLWNRYGSSSRFIEIYSASKAYNLTGFRLGFLLANPHLIEDLKVVRNLYDSGTYLPLQYGFAEALDHEEIIDALKEKYHRRLVRMQEILHIFRYPSIFPKGSFYLYTGIPENRKWKNATQFADALLQYAGILVVPFDKGEGGLRFSMTYSTPNEEEFFQEFRRRLILFEDFLSQY